MVKVLRGAGSTVRRSVMICAWENWDFCIALSRLGRVFVKLPEVMFFYRVQQISREHLLCFFGKLRCSGLCEFTIFIILMNPRTSV